MADSLITVRIGHVSVASDDLPLVVSKIPRQRAELDDRNVRALTEHMTILDEGGDIYTMIGQKGGSEYCGDPQEGWCNCPDHKHRSAHYKILRHVAFDTDKRMIPRWLASEGREDQLYEHADNGSKVATDAL